MRLLRVFRRVAGILLLLLAILLLRNPSCAYGVEIKIAGGSTALGSIQKLASAFEKSHSGVRFQIYPGIGSNGGLKAVSEGAVDIGLMGRPLNGKELNMGLTSREFAKTPLVFIAGENVTISGLRSEELVKIYRGERSRWPNGEHIRPIVYSASDIDTALLKQISPEMGKALDMMLARPGMIVASSTQEGYDKVKSTPGSLGFCALTTVLTGRGSVKILSYSGVFPNINNLRNGSYPLSKSLYLVVRSTPSGPVREFIDFISSPQGARILEKTGNLAISGGQNVRTKRH